jgi:hypothetical protein
MRKISFVKKIGIALCLVSLIAIGSFFESVYRPNFSSFTHISEASTDLHYNRFIFYIHPSLVPDMQFAKAVLPVYTQDLNTILAKNTTRRLIFNPDTDIILTETTPQSNSCCSAGATIPKNDFQLWAHVTPTTSTMSNGGFSSLNSDGSGVLAGLHWTRLYDPNALVTSNDNDDYWRQLNNMAHELGHVFGVGLGEYYSLSTVFDNTGEEPIQDVRLLNHINDPYWKRHSDRFTDPMLLNVMHHVAINPLPTTREAAMNIIQFSPLSAAIISESYRAQPNNARLPDMDAITVKVVDSVTGNPVGNAVVKVWQIDMAANDSAIFNAEGMTNQQGTMSYDWSTNATIYHSNVNLLREFKVYRAGYIPKAFHFSVFDAEEVKILQGLNQLTITIPVDPDPHFVDTIAPTGSFVEPLFGTTLKGSVNLSVSAQDNVGIEKVTFLLDGQLIATDLTAPYSTVLDTTKFTDTTHMLSAVIRDVSGNSYTALRKIAIFNPLIIDSVSILKTGSNYVVLSWKTNKPTTSSIYYETLGRFPPVRNTLTSLALGESTFIIDHKVVIKGLSSRTKYRLFITSIDKESNRILSEGITFATLP